MTFLAIDPGIATGWALLDVSGQLVACGLGEDWPLEGLRAAIIERPQVYRASKSKGDPNDLITLAIRVGRYQERLLTRGVSCDLVLPTTWKGQIPKDIHHVRIKSELSQPELSATVAGMYKLTKTLAENVWDAVGLAKYAFRAGRFANG